MEITKCTRFICNVLNKKEYIVHIRALQQTLNHGLKITKIHRIIQFNQDDWLKPYIDMNTELRKHAKNEFEKRFIQINE